MSRKVVKWKFCKKKKRAKTQKFKCQIHVKMDVNSRMSYIAFVKFGQRKISPHIKKVLLTTNFKILNLEINNFHFLKMLYKECLFLDFNSEHNILLLTRSNTNIFREPKHLTKDLLSFLAFSKLLKNTMKYVRFTVKRCMQIDKNDKCINVNAIKR